MFGIGGVRRAYKSLVYKLHHHEKNYSTNKSKPEDHDDKFKSIDELCKALNAKDDEGKPMNGINHFNNHSVLDSFITSSMSAPLSRSTSLSRNPSFSKSASRRSKTPAPVSAAKRFLRNLSRKNSVDTSVVYPGVSPSRNASRKASSTKSSSPERVSLFRKVSRKASSTTRASLSRSASRKASSRTSASLEGGSLYRSTSSQKTAFPSEGSLSKCLSQKRSAPIMYSNSNGLMKPPAIEKNLECTLEELCFGCVKRITVTRDVVTNDGQVVEEEETLTIKVKPGWRKGTKITFNGTENETAGTYPADIILVIAERGHSLFKREGDDLELAMEVPLLTSLTGCTLLVPLLGGEKMCLKIDDIIEPGYEKVIAGQGMPKSKENKNRGNLVIKFMVQFPTKLTVKQRSDIFSILQNSC